MDKYLIFLSTHLYVIYLRGSDYEKKTYSYNDCVSDAVTPVHHELLSGRYGACADTDSESSSRSNEG